MIGKRRKTKVLNRFIMELVTFRERVSVPLFVNETLNLEVKHVKRVSRSLENFAFDEVFDTVLLAVCDSWEHGKCSEVEHTI